MNESIGSHNSAPYTELSFDDEGKNSAGGSQNVYFGGVSTSAKISSKPPIAANSARQRALFQDVDEDIDELKREDPSSSAPARAALPGGAMRKSLSASAGAGLTEATFKKILSGERSSVIL